MNDAPSDGLVRYNAYKNNPRTASYYFEVERGGVTIARELDDERHEKRPIAEAMPGAPVAHVPTRWVPDGAGGFTEEPSPAVGRWIPTDDHAAYTLVAVPHTLSHQSLPEIRVEIEPGMHPIWAHQVVDGYNYDDKIADGEVLLVGRRLADGTEEITTVHPDGATFTHTDHLQAVIHTAQQHSRVFAADAPQD